MATIGNHICQLCQLIQFLVCAIALHNFFEQLAHALCSLSARRTFSAAFKMDKFLKNLFNGLATDNF